MMGSKSANFILVLLLSASLSSQLPSCQEQRIVFTAEPTDIVIGCGIDDVAVFRCQYNGSLVRPQWIINSTVYSSRASALPPDHSYSNYHLFVRSGIKYNNTLYQCQILPSWTSTDGSLCAYKSTPGRLIIKCIRALQVNCTPRYQFFQSLQLRFDGISTTIIQPDDYGGSFNVTYSDSLSGRRCESTMVPVSSCMDGICQHNFNVSSSLPCSKATAIDVAVTSIHPDVYMFGPTTIDTINNFVQVSFESLIMALTFLNQSIEEMKYFSIMYAPITQGCEHSPTKLSGYLTNTNSLSLQLIQNVTVCFILEVSNGGKTVWVEGIYSPDETSEPTLLTISSVFIAVATSLIFILISIILCCCNTGRHTHDMKNRSFLDEEEIEVELDENYINRSTGANVDHPNPIDISTTYFKLFDVTEECCMYEFGMKHFPDYKPEDGFGYFKKSGSNWKSIPPHNKVILMDEGLPRFTASSSAIKPNTIDIYTDIYEQSRNYTMKLIPGSSFLYCACSRDVTTTTFWKVYDVSIKCKECDFAKRNIPRYTLEWSQYCYFEFTEPEYIKPHQRIIVLMKDGKLVTGPGIRHLVGVTGDGSKMTYPSRINDQWDCIFIQRRTANRELIPGTKYLFCALTNKVHAQYSIYNIRKGCEMAKIGEKHIPGFKSEQGNGYYQFTQETFLQPLSRVILMHKDKSLYSGDGAKFICTGDKHMDAVLGKRMVSPPDLSETEWELIFIQSHLKEAVLLSGTKFLYCEYNRAHKQSVY